MGGDGGGDSLLLLSHQSCAGTHITYFASERKRGWMKHLISIETICNTVILEILKNNNKD